MKSLTEILNEGRAPVTQISQISSSVFAFEDNPLLPNGVKYCRVKASDYPQFKAKLKKGTDYEIEDIFIEGKMYKNQEYYAVWFFDTLHFLFSQDEKQPFNIYFIKNLDCLEELFDFAIRKENYTLKGDLGPDGEMHYYYAKGSKRMPKKLEENFITDPELIKKLRFNKDYFGGNDLGYMSRKAFAAMKELYPRDGSGDSPASRYWW